MYLRQFVNICTVFQTHLCLGMCPAYHTFFFSDVIVHGALHIGIQWEAASQPVSPHWPPHLKRAELSTKVSCYLFTNFVYTLVKNLQIWKYCLFIRGGQKVAQLWPPWSPHGASAAINNFCSSIAATYFCPQYQLVLFCSAVSRALQLAKSLLALSLQSSLCWVVPCFVSSSIQQQIASWLYCLFLHVNHLATYNSF